MNNPHIKTILLKSFDIFLGIIGIAIAYSAFYFDVKFHIKIVLIITGLILVIFSILLLIKIDIKYGYYECSRCNEKFTPTLKDTLTASRFHYFENAREIRCPKCNIKTTCFKKY